MVSVLLKLIQLFPFLLLIKPCWLIILQLMKQLLIWIIL